MKFATGSRRIPGYVTGVCATSPISGGGTELEDGRVGRAGIGGRGRTRAAGAPFKRSVGGGRGAGSRPAPRPGSHRPMRLVVASYWLQISGGQRSPNLPKNSFWLSSSVFQSL